MWLEFLSPDSYLKHLKFLPDIDKSVIMVEYEVVGIGSPNLHLNIEVFLDNNHVISEDLNLDFIGKIGHARDKKVFKERVEIFYKNHYRENANRFKTKLKIPKHLLSLWDIDTPNLYDICVKIYNKQTNEIFMHLHER